MDIFKMPEVTKFLIPVKKFFLSFNGINYCPHLRQNYRLVSASGSYFQNFIQWLHLQKFSLVCHRIGLRNSLTMAYWKSPVNISLIIQLFIHKQMSLCISN